MKKIILISLLIISGKLLRAQELAQIKFSGGSNFSGFSLVTDGNVLIRFSPEGQIIDWGIEEQSYRVPNYFSPKLIPYSGRVSYYDNETDPVLKGKIKSIGSCQFTYFNSYEDSAKKGRLKSAGRLSFDYYSGFDIKELQGRMKILASQLISYFTTFDDVAYRGKLKSVGNTAITYYSSFDDKAIKGKVKSIGNIVYYWYSSYDVNFGPGSLKNNNYRQQIAGITYIIQ